MSDRGPRPPRRRAGVRIPARLRAWITDPRSLTRRLRGACPGGFRVRVLRQTPQRRLAGEAARLGVDRRERALVREVLLLCEERPWVYARTVIPQSSLRGAERRLAHLGTRPLGALLFSRREARRETLEVEPLPPTGRLRRAVEAAVGRLESTAWVRRSRFRRGGRPLLVTEVFLPSFGDPQGAARHRRGLVRSRP